MSQTRAEPDQPIDPDDLLRRACGRIDAGEDAAALADLERYLGLVPDDPYARLYRGIVLCRQDRFPEALADLTEAIPHLEDSARVTAFRWRGYVYRHQNCPEAAIGDLNQAVRLEPRDARLWCELAAAHELLGDDEAALAAFNAAHRIAPTDARILVHLASLHFELADLVQAGNELEQAIALDPECADAFLWRGKLHLEALRYEDAIRDLSEAIRLDPNGAAAWRSRAGAWASLEDFGRAIADYSESLRLEPDHAYAAEQLEILCEMYGPSADACEHFLRPVHASHGDSETMTTPPSTSTTLVASLLRSHFDPLRESDLTITRREFPIRVRADLQCAVDELVARNTVCKFCGVFSRYRHEDLNFAGLFVPSRTDPVRATSPQYDELDVGEPHPLRCLQNGLWLLADGAQRYAVLLDLKKNHICNVGVTLQIATANDPAGAEITSRFFEHLETSVQEARSYRGRVLSLEYESQYSGEVTGIRIHKLRPVSREDVILPQKTLELLERNVIRFVEQRPRLAARGLSTRKGLLFYGPPGTGKTHTIHYLAAALPGMTTLLITAEQVILLHEYMALARLLQPTMVVIEDADLIARDRTTMSAADEEVLLNKLLNEMDGLREDADILFVLTTNRPEMLEAALASRPGRIDQAIEFPYPDEAGRRKLVSLYAAGLSVPNDVLEVVVRRTEHVSPAFIRELMRRAAQFQFERGGNDELHVTDVENALEELLFSGGSLNRTLLGSQAEV